MSRSWRPGRGRVGGTRQGYAARPDDAPGRQPPVPLRCRHDRRDDARQEDRLAIHLEDRSPAYKGRSKFTPSSGSRRPDDDRRDRQPPDHRGRPRRQDRARDAADRRQAQPAPRHPPGPQAGQRPLPGLPRRRRHGPRVRPDRARWSGATPSTSTAGPAPPGHEGHGTEVFGALRLAQRQHADRRRQRQPRDRGRLRKARSSGASATTSCRASASPGSRRSSCCPTATSSSATATPGPTTRSSSRSPATSKVVWTFKDFKTFGNSLAAAQVLDINGEVFADQSPRARGRFRRKSRRRGPPGAEH